MTEASKNTGEDQTEQVIAEGVDDEPVETNRRMFSGNLQLVLSLIHI